MEGLTGQEVGRVYVIGGAEIYSIAMKSEWAKVVLLTEVYKLAEPRGDGGFECDVFFPEFRKGMGWVWRGHERLCEFVGEAVPAGVQVEGEVGFEYQMWERE